MKNLSILALLGTTLASNFTPEHDEMKFLWGTWKDTHGKGYNEAEEPYRLSIFVQNYNMINAHNAQNGTVTLGLNHFADLTPDEWQSKFASGHTASPPSDETPSDQDEVAEGRNLRGAQDRNLGSLPASVDWRAKGAVGPVKNQVHCDGCWSFATTGALESLHFIKTGSMESFSEQQLLDCNKNSRGCSGGDFANGLAYAATYGIELESNYPFIQKTGTCKYSASRAQKVSKGHTMVSRNNANALMSALVNQPVSIAIEATQPVFQFYKSGVITANCGSATNHAVLAVGYTTVNGVKSFIVKNSWGPHWGQSGFLYISANGSANGGKGVCGILSYPGYPTA